MISASVSASLRASRPWAVSATRAVSTTQQSVLSPTSRPGYVRGRCRTGAGIAASLQPVEAVAAGESVGALQLKGSAGPSARLACLA